jgi:hypothetical protein
MAASDLLRSPPRMRVMDRNLLRTLARWRRILFEIYALPEGTLPPELEDAVEDLLMPGYRERLMAAYLASLPTGEQVH